MDRTWHLPLALETKTDHGDRMTFLPLLEAAYVILGATLSVRAADVNRLSAEEVRLGFISLFDGKSFNGWEQKGNWVIEAGALARRSAGGPITYTVSTVPDDFELRFEWNVSKGCNSGVYYRPGQYEYQVLDNANSPYGENPRQSAASLFFCMAPSHDARRARTANGTRPGSSAKAR